MPSPVKFKKSTYSFELLRLSSSSAGNLAEAALKQNFLCGMQTGIVLGLSRCKKPSNSKYPEVTFTAKTSVMMNTDADDNFNQHLISARSHQVQLMWLRTLQRIDQDLNLKQINHPLHLQKNLSGFNQQRWLNLLNDFALEAELENPHALFRNGEMTYFNQSVKLNYSEDHPDYFVMQIHLGRVPASFPDSLKQTVYKSMLQANHNGSMASGMSWAIDPKTANVVINFQVSVWSLDQMGLPIDCRELDALVSRHVQLSQETWIDVLELNSYADAEETPDFAKSALPERLELTRPSWSEIH